MVKKSLTNHIPILLIRAETDCSLDAEQQSGRNPRRRDESPVTGGPLLLMSVSSDPLHAERIRASTFLQ
ncbi:hypothetical protein AVEN_208812-1, partial [Araneus ventricosus]